jgi:PAS domain S-box-containing protein
MGILEDEQGHGILLRRRAEEALRGKEVEVLGLSTTDIQYLLHELQVHQAELAMQNAELRQTQEALEISRDRFADLYNFAPAGYCTTDSKDTIIEANHSLAYLLGYDKSAIIHQTFSHFVARMDKDKYYLYRKRDFSTHMYMSCEIRLVKQTGEPIFVRLESKRAKESNHLMIMVIDISEQRDLQNRIIDQREKERQKVARDLHDGPIQVLAGLNFTVTGMLMDHPDDEFSQSLAAVQASLREQIQVLRDFSVELRTPLLAHMGLESALRSTLHNFGEKFGDVLIRLAIQHVGPSLTEEASLALFRICQEALQNVSKHTINTVTSVTARLYKEDNQVVMEIEDNGTGFHIPENWMDLARKGHLGLVGMRERAEAVGGELLVQSSEDKGTLIRVLVPAKE